MQQWISEAQCPIIVTTDRKDTMAYLCIEVDLVVCKPSFSMCERGQLIQASAASKPALQQGKVSDLLEHAVGLVCRSGARLQFKALDLQFSTLALQVSPQLARPTAPLSHLPAR